jgi:hypothetical protein
MPWPDAIEVFAPRLDQAAIPWVITGGMAVLYYGEPRTTLDIGLVLSLPAGAVHRIAAAFPEPRFYSPPPEVLHLEASRPGRGHFNLLDLETGHRADCYLAARDETLLWALRNARIEQRDGIAARFAPPEYVIVKKLEFHAEGGSERHLSDILGILALTPDIDFSKLRELAAACRVESALQTLLSDLRPSDI